MRMAFKYYMLWSQEQSTTSPFFAIQAFHSYIFKNAEKYRKKIGFFYQQ